MQVESVCKLLPCHENPRAGRRKAQVTDGCIDNARELQRAGPEGTAPWDAARWEEARAREGEGQGHVKRRGGGMLGEEGMGGRSRQEVVRVLVFFDSSLER